MARAALTLLLIGATAGPVAAQAPPRIVELDATIEALMVRGHFPGAAMAVVRDGEPIHVGSYGLADIAHEAPVTSRTVFELASLTKQMTALAILTLVEEGRLGLDERLVDHVEDPPEAWAGITVDQLLSHTAGLEHRFERTVDDVLLLEYTREDMLASAKATPTLSEPGTDWSYSDQGYFLLGVIVESVTGRSFADHMQAVFFEPLGMERTHLLDQRRIVPGLAQGYAWTDDGLERSRRVWQFELTSHFGVMSSLEDMLRWEAELSNPEVVNRAALEATWEIRRTFDTGGACDSWGYGRGWQVHVANGRRVLTHGGYAGTGYLRFVDDGLSIIVLTNREDAPDELSPVALGWEVAHAVDPAIPAGGYRCWE